MICICWTAVSIGPEGLCLVNDSSANKALTRQVYEGADAEADTSLHARWAVNRRQLTQLVNHHLRHANLGEHGTAMLHNMAAVQSVSTQLPVSNDTKPTASTFSCNGEIHQAVGPNCQQASRTYF